MQGLFLGLFPSPIPFSMTGRTNSKLNPNNNGDVTPKHSTDSRTLPTTAENVLIIDWDGPNDPQNPKKWSYRKKWTSTIIVSLFTLNTPVSSSMISPASEAVAQQFGITNNVIIAMTTSIFVLAYGKYLYVFVTYHASNICCSRRTSLSRPTQ